MGSLTKANDLERRREALRSAKAPSVTRQMTVRSLVDHWDAMTTEERKRLVGFIFEEVRAGVDGIKRFLPWEDWRRYMRTVLGCLPERKTGLEPPVRTHSHATGPRRWAGFAAVGRMTCSTRQRISKHRAIHEAGLVSDLQDRFVG
jgi:hypothetical protein